MPSPDPVELSAERADGSPDGFAADQQLCVALYNASRAIQGAYRPLLDELGLTYSQYTVMLVLWRSKSVTLGHLGEQLLLDSGTLSPLLRRLETMGLVERRRGTDDERILHLSLTEKGRDLEAGARAAQRRVEEMTGLESGELVGLRDELRALTERLAAARRSVPA